VAPLFILGEVEFGVISQSSMAFSHLIGAFSLVVTQFQSISSYAVVLARLGALDEGVERVEAAGAHGIELVEAGDQLVYEGLTLRSPQDGSVLLDALSLTVPVGACVLVSGANEAARIALFRATAGLWSAGEGRVVRPPRPQLLFLPERPYLPPGTLREAVLRTGHEEALEDERILEVLRALGADAVLGRTEGLDVERDWDDLLSLGEQQLLSVARLVLAAPRFALLDRPATTLGESAAMRAVDLLAAHSITVVTFAADGALAEHHGAELELAEDGSWSWHPTRRENATR
jgi:putative ATP-binding cassette transporter